MGIDFLKRTSRTFERCFQRGYEDLRDVRLFDPSVTVEQRTFIAQLDETPTSQEDPLVLRLAGEKIEVYSNERRIAVSENPPAAILEKLRAADQGLAVAHISQIHEISGTADISVS